MRKEVLIAIVIGFALGLLITYGIWTANRAIKEATANNDVASEKITSENITPTPGPTVNKLALSITTPEDNDLVNKQKIEVSGTTVPNAIVVVTYPDGESIISAGADGKFTTNINLDAGSNDLGITAFDTQTGNEASQNLTVVFSTAEI